MDVFRRAGEADDVPIQRIERRHHLRGQDERFCAQRWEIAGGLRQGGVEDRAGARSGFVTSSGGGVTTPVSDTTQSFSSVGGSITVTVTNGVLSLGSSSPAAGFTTEVHDNEPTRVEVRFFDGSTEWRIRIELGSGGLTSEITQHS